MSAHVPPREHFRTLRQHIDDIRAATKDTLQVVREGSDKFLAALEACLHPCEPSALGQEKIGLNNLLAESLQDLVTSSMQARAPVEAFKTMLEGVPLEPDDESDRCGVSLSIWVGESLHVLESYQHQLSMAVLAGIGAPNTEKLDEHIAYWEQAKADLVDLWPWSTGPVPLPPADREMIARSRAALEGGEQGEDIDAVIARRRSE